MTEANPLRTTTTEAGTVVSYMDTTTDFGQEYSFVVCPSCYDLDPAKVCVACLHQICDRCSFIDGCKLCKQPVKDST